MPAYEYGFTQEPTRPPAHPIQDAALVKRVADAYRQSVKEFPGHGTSLWAGYDIHNNDFRKAFETDDLKSLTSLLRNPGDNELFWGFDWVSHRKNPNFDGSPEAQLASAVEHYGAIVKLAIGVGAIRCPYPEAGKTAPELPIEEILAALDNKFGFRVDFPNPFQLEFGLMTSRGVASYRAIQALYQAWKLKQVTALVDGGSILEIGAGLGRNAYYAMKLGLVDYTIVDIPMTQVAQGYFLGRVLGENAIGLCGEEKGNVRLRSPAWLHRSSRKFDVTLNADSLTEIGRENALAYVAFARDRSRAFLSINHEVNPFPVAELLQEVGMTLVYRSPYWARDGYVEELALGRMKSSKIAGHRRGHWAARLLKFDSPRL